MLAVDKGNSNYVVVCSIGVLSMRPQFFIQQMNYTSQDKIKVPTRKDYYP